MSYAEIKPQYYQMHMPDSPWHAGSEGWKSARWPSFGVNPNLVGPPRLAVEGLGAYFKPVYEKPIAGLGDDSAPMSTAAKVFFGVLVLGVAGYLVFGSKPQRSGSNKDKPHKFTEKEIAAIKHRAERNADADTQAWLKTPAAQRMRREKPELFR